MLSKTLSARGTWIVGDGGRYCGTGRGASQVLSYSNVGEYDMSVALGDGFEKKVSSEYLEVSLALLALER